MPRFVRYDVGELVDRWCVIDRGDRQIDAESPFDFQEQADGHQRVAAEIEEIAVEVRSAKREAHGSISSRAVRPVRRAASTMSAMPEFMTPSRARTRLQAAGAPRRRSHSVFHNLSEPGANTRQQPGLVPIPACGGCRKIRA